MDELIFVNYRQVDSSWSAEFIADKLRSVFGDNSVFLDNRAIAAGDDISDKITQALRAVKVLLVVIGSDWLRVQDSAGRRRIDSPSDWVQFEIKTCLNLPECSVVPVLLDDATLPDSGDLPPAIARMADCKSIRLERGNKAVGLAVIEEAIKKICGQSGNIRSVSSRKIVFEKLSQYGRIDLSTIGDPYDFGYDPEEWSNRSVNIFVCFPKLDYINAAPRTHQLPSVALCIDARFEVNVNSFLDDSLFDKLIKLPSSKIYNEDKEKIINSISPIFDKGFISGVSLPVRLFSSQILERKQRYTYGAMLNALVLPLIKFHRKLDYTISTIRFLSVGDRSYDARLLSMVKSEVNMEVCQVDDIGVECIVRLFSWCIGSDANSDSNNDKWVKLIKNG